MTAKPTLSDLRQKIDLIDDQLHDLLQARAGLTSTVRQIKSGTSAQTIQPKREAEILRRLLNRHSSELPFGVVVRIWREIISASAHSQQALSVAVCCHDLEPGAWDIARDHFGSMIPMTAYLTAGQTIRAVTDKSCSVGVLSFPTEHDNDPWWRQILSRDPNSPRVMARLPVFDKGNARASGDMLVISTSGVDVSSFDRALIAVEFPTELSRTRLLSSLSATGLNGTLLALQTAAGLCVALADVAGPVSQDDPRFLDLQGQLGGAFNSSVLHLGGYALPLSALNTHKI